MRALTALCAVMLSLLAAVACPEARPVSSSREPEAGANTATRSAPGPSGSAHDNTAVNIASLPSGSAPSGGTYVWLRAADGYNIAAWYFAPPAAKVKGALAPAVLLLHMRGKDKSSWGAVPQKLQKEGYAVIAIDLRGHGESLDQSGQSPALSSLRDSDYQNMLLDLQCAHEYITKQKGVDSDRLAIIGASIGANLGLMYCALDRRVRTVVALSPGLDYRGLKPLDSMDGVDKRAVYLVASRGDSASATACETLSKSGHPDGVKSLRLFDGSAHGTDIFAAQPGFDDTIINGWLLNTVPPKR